MTRTEVQSGLRSAARRILTHKSVGCPASTVLRLIGAHRLGGKIDKLCRYVPNKFRVQIPTHVAPHASFQIDSNHGHEQAACSLWWKGWGGYEALVTNLFAACSREAKCIFDVGANSGLFSLTAAACSPSAAIHAFEPYPPSRALLERNLALNHFEKRVQIRAEAVSEKPGELNLYVPLQDKQGYDETSCSLNAGFRPQHSKVLPVPVITLDDYCAGQKIAHVDLLKIDVETHEPQVLRGAANILESRRPIVFLEVLGVADTSALTEIVTRHKYASIVLGPDHLEVCPTVMHRAGSYNQVFCPIEKLPALKKTASRLRYLILDE